MNVALFIRILPFLVGSPAAAQDPVVNPDAKVTVQVTPTDEKFFEVKMTWTGFEKAGDPNPVEVYLWRLDVKNANGRGTTKLQDYTSVTKNTSAGGKFGLEPKRQYLASVMAKRKNGVVEIASDLFRLAKPKVDGAAVDPLKPIEPPDKIAVPESVRDALENPDTRNRVLRGLLEHEDQDWPLIKGLDLELKAMTAEDRETLLGVGYSYLKEVHLLKSDTELSGLDLSFRAEGTIASNSKKNPENFLVTTLSLDYFTSKGGVEPGKTPEGRRLQALLMGETLKTKEELRNSEGWREYHKRMQDHLSTQVYVDVQLQASLESDQTFSTKQYAFELQGCLDIKAWKNSSDEAKLNIFDWPFAFVRIITGYDEEIRIRGAAFPTLLVGLGRIKPIDEDPRAAAGDRDDFWRFRAEASFRTPVARVAGSSVFANANLRYYQEIRASASVKAARLDKFTYYSFALASDQGVYVSYSGGRLPFDAKDDRIYEVGYRFAF